MHFHNSMPFAIHLTKYSAKRDSYSLFHLIRFTCKSYDIKKRLWKMYAEQMIKMIMTIRAWINKYESIWNGMNNLSLCRRTKYSIATPSTRFTHVNFTKFLAQKLNIQINFHSKFDHDQRQKSTPNVGHAI